MTPVQKFHLSVTVFTVALMSLVLSRVIPWLETKQTSTGGVSLLIGGAGSVGVYSTTAKLLLALLETSRTIKRLIFGKDDLQGTWIGSYKRGNGQTIYSVEHFEQNLNGLHIKGKGFTDSGEVNGEWTSVACAVDSNDKTLIYAYVCDRYGQSMQFQGVCVFTLERPTSSKRPMTIHGYSADLTENPRKTENREIRIHDDFMDMKEAFDRAKEKFSTGTDFDGMLFKHNEQRPNKGK